MLPEDRVNPCVISWPDEEGFVSITIRVKGDEWGLAIFSTEDEALRYAQTNELVPGWRISRMPRPAFVAGLQKVLVNGTAQWIVLDPSGDRAPAMSILKFLAEVEGAQ